MTKVIQYKEFNAYQFMLGTVTASNVKSALEAELPGISITTAYIIKETVDNRGFTVGGYLALGINHPDSRGGKIVEDTFHIYSGDWLVETESTGYELVPNEKFQKRFTQKEQ